MVTKKQSSEALMGPSRRATVPTSFQAITCSERAAVTPSATPSLIMGTAPPVASSAGWKTIRISPAKRSRCCAKMRAAPIIVAMWTSWPHLWATPGTWDRYGQSSGKPSSMGRASMSARSRTVATSPVGTGREPRMEATTPVLATCVLMLVTPSICRSFSSMNAAVLNSWNATSGFWCRCRRISMRSVCISSASERMPMKGRFCDRAIELSKSMD
mmetsp:Transcript_86609/g.150785  ORF Transcript_86609/g.150785 Transcript_86609/m.150785 type:complete len:215 (+) Transcript_86609:837-1481(+)